MKNKDKLKNLNIQVANFAIKLDSEFSHLYKELIMTSGFRDKDHPNYTKKSYHSFGLAIDFTVLELNIEHRLGLVLDVYKYCLEYNKSAKLKVVELELVHDKRNPLKWHIHVAFDDRKGRKLKFFTGTYK